MSRSRYRGLGGGAATIRLPSRCTHERRRLVHRVGCVSPDALPCPCEPDLLCEACGERLDAGICFDWEGE